MRQTASGNWVIRTAGAVAIVIAIAVIAGAARGIIRGGATRLSSKLAGTSAVPNGTGKASLNLRKATAGRFVVTAKHLRGRGAYDLIVGGVKVGALQTNPRGNGQVTFSTTPHGKASLLGFDPRGDHVLVRDSQSGVDVLAGSIPEDTPGAGACCLTDSHGESECEDLSATDCTTAGGTPQTGVTSCLPDPCSTSTAPSPNTVCCINTTHDDGTETNCEDSSEADCAAAGGTLVQAASCDANPCQPAPAVNVSACCITHTDSSETECEVMSADACTASGGATNAAASCDPDPCQTTPPTDRSACCIPQANGEPSECEDLSASACAAAGGGAPTNGSTTCDPNPCA